MEFFPVIQGKKLPEVYHFGFSGTHFQFFLGSAYWFQFVNLAGRGTHYASGQDQAYVLPTIFGGAFGQHGCARVSKVLDGSVCIEVPAFLEKTDDENQIVSMRTLGHTLSSISFVLQHLLHETDERNEKVEQGLSQLFVIETTVAHEPGFHSAGLGLSLSPLARKYLEGLGKGSSFVKAEEAMKAHYLGPLPDEKEVIRSFHGDFVIRLREHGVLHMNTMGNCACLGTMPKDFGDQGCCFSSHNVDTVFQQFNLLVGIAYVWQMVRDGLLTQTQMP